jgi:hypothetical protein
MAQDTRRKLDYLLFFTETLSSPVGEFVSELHTSEIPEGIMKHAVYVKVAQSWSLDLIQLTQPYFRMTGSCEKGNELSGSITCGKFLY